jgi:lipoprotein-anchoring transpeptidase ErfK/SrfK
MSRTHTLIAAAAGLLLLAGAGAVYAYDSSRSDTIAAGVHVGSVDVGGLSARAARAKLDARLLEPLRRPLVIVAGETEFPLSAREAKLEADTAAMVREAVARGRQGSILQRTWRGLTGGEVKATVTPTVAYSQAAVRRLVDRVRVKMSRKPVDADIALRGERIAVRRSRPGLAVDPKRLRRQVERGLVSDTTPPRSVRVALRKIAPKVTTARLARRYKVVLAVDRSHFRVTLFKRLKRVHTYPIAVGQVGLETPAGRYTIQNKAVNPAWHVPNSAWAGSLAGSVIPGGAPNNPIKARWLGVYDGVGLHGTSDRASIGSNASHGCIRMLIEDVIKLYDEVPVGTPIFIS